MRSHLMYHINYHYYTIMNNHVIKLAEANNKDTAAFIESLTNCLEEPLLKRILNKKIF